MRRRRSDEASNRRCARPAVTVHHGAGGQLDDVSQELDTDTVTPAVRMYAAAARTGSVSEQAPTLNT